MAVPIDVEALSAPLAGIDPTGVDLRLGNDPDFSALREKVDEAYRRRRTLERGEQADPPDWIGVAGGSAKLLAQKTKDIQILSWMIEASTRAYSIEGLCYALEAAAKLINQFMPQMHPRPEPGDEEFRLRPLIGLDNNGSGTLVPLIRQQPIIVAPGMNGEGSFTVLHQQQAVTVEKLEPERREQRVREGAVTSAQIAKAAARMESAQVAATDAFLDRAIRATESLRDGFLRHCGPDAPPTSAILEALQDCRAMLASFTKDKIVATSTPESAGLTSSASGAAAGSPSHESAGVRSLPMGNVAMERESVLKAIDRLVSALDSLEPQNLAVPALRQATAWARMDRVALLSDLLGNSSADTARDKLFRLIGLKAPPEKSEE